LRSLLEKISKHLFESTIWSIGYFGTKELPKLWIELRSSSKTDWISFDLSTQMSQKICSFEPTSKIKTWLKGVGNIGLFLRLKSGINPGIEALEAYDLLSGKLIYEVDISQWIKITPSHIQVIQEKKRYWINARNGHFETPENPNEDSTDPFLFENPSHFEENQPGFSDFKLFFKQNFDEIIVKAVDCWDGNDKIIFSYYLYEDGLKNILRVCDKGFKTEHQEIIAKGETIGFNTFQIFKRTLIYIKDKHQLILYEF
jgi:hypothetical protein